MLAVYNFSKLTSRLVDFTLFHVFDWLTRIQRHLFFSAERLTRKECKSCDAARRRGHNLFTSIITRTVNRLNGEIGGGTLKYNYNDAQCYTL